MDDNDLTPERRRRIDAMAKIFRDTLEEYSRRYNIPASDLFQQLGCECRQRWGRYGCDEFDPPSEYRPECDAGDDLPVS